MPAEPDPSPAPSVFRAPDQSEMIARLDAVEDDDLGSSFFDTSAREAEEAALRIFDVGIRTLVEEPGRQAAAPEVPAFSPPGGGPAPDLTDAAARAAFILGGPAGIGYSA